MTQRSRDHEPFDRARWARSVEGETLRVTAPTPPILPVDRDEAEIHPVEPDECIGTQRKSCRSQSPAISVAYA